MSRFTIYKWKLIYPIAWHIAIVLPHLNGCKFFSENGLVHRIFDTTYNGNNALLIWIEGADCLGANWNWAQYVRYGITWNQGAYEHRLRNDDFLTALKASNSILTMCWYWFIDVWLSNVSPPSHAKRAPNIILSAIYLLIFQWTMTLVIPNIVPSSLLALLHAIRFLFWVLQRIQKWKTLNLFVHSLINILNKFVEKI